jgi:CBS domain-containing protein
MKASDVMVHEVITTAPNSSVHDAAAILIANHISAVPVTDTDRKLLGILSEGDLLRRSETDTERRRSWWLESLTSTETLAQEYVKTHSRRVSDVMTRSVIVAQPDTPLRDIAALLERNRIKRIPIVQDDKLVGLVSRADLVRALASWRRDLPHAIPEDVALQEAVVANLKKEPWAHIALVSVTAREGRIDLSGLVESQLQRDAIRVAAEVTPGVRAVSDNLSLRPILADV